MTGEGRGGWAESKKGMQTSPVRGFVFYCSVSVILSTNVVC